MVAGGVGLAPFATLAEALRARGVRRALFYGARRAAELFYLDFFRDLDVELVLTTEDGSLGERGRVVAPLERRLAVAAGRGAPSWCTRAARKACWPRPRSTAHEIRPSVSGLGRAHHGLRPRRLLQLRRADARRRRRASITCDRASRAGAAGDQMRGTRRRCRTGTTVDRSGLSRLTERDSRWISPFKSARSRSRTR